MMENVVRSDIQGRNPENSTKKHTVSVTQPIILHPETGPEKPGFHNKNSNLSNNEDYEKVVFADVRSSSGVLFARLVR